MKTTTKILFFSVIALILAACSGKSDNAYTISGSFPDGTDAEWVYLYSNAIDAPPTILDSAKVVNGQFKFQGNAPDTIIIGILSRQPKADNMRDFRVDWSFFIEKGDIVVDTDLFAHGTPTNDGYGDWMKQIFDTPSEKELTQFFLDHWSEHSSDFIGPYTLYMCSGMMDFAIVDSLTRQIPADLMQQYALFRDFQKQLDVIRSMQPGNMFTDSQLTTLDGNTVKLSDYIGHGEYVLVDFWASWCGPCRQAMPEVHEFAQKNKNVKVLGIAVNDEVADTKRVMNDLNITWTVLSDPEALTAKTYGIQAIPAMILFAPDGTIAARDFKIADIDEFIK